MNLPSGARRMVVKKPVAASRSASGSDFIHASTSALVASGGIEVAPRGLGGRAGHERLVVVEPRPRALVEQEAVQPRAAERRAVAREVEQHRLVAGPHLAQEQRVHHLRGLRPGVAAPARSPGGSAAQIGGEIRRREAGHRLPQRGNLAPGVVGRRRGRLSASSTPPALSRGWSNSRHGSSDNHGSSAFWPNPSAHFSGRPDCWLISWKLAQTTGSLG